MNFLRIFSNKKAPPHPFPIRNEYWEECVDAHRRHARNSEREKWALAALPGVIVAYKEYASEHAFKNGNGGVNAVFARIAFATADACIEEASKETANKPSSK